MKQLVLLCFFSFAFLLCHAQNNDCKVLLKSIEGRYEGDCDKGKANGKGKAAGTDIYEGGFKNGLPEGIGTYTWNDGHYFTGSFKKGNKEGKGEMHFKKINAEDSVITGFWKKDKYIGEYENDYVVTSKSSRVTKVDCMLTDKKGAEIVITLSSRGGSSSNQLPSITNINVLMGNFYSTNTESMSIRSITRIQQVTFPFKAIFFIGNDDSMEIQFNTKADYEVSVELF